jgi:hypothetical protein
MANAFFLNATPYIIAVNLNTALQNQILAPQISVAAESAILAGWQAPIAARPFQGQFGGDESQNLMLVISAGSSSYIVWEIRSSVPVGLDLYFYILGDQVVGADKTGRTGGIVVTGASKVVAKQVFMRAPPAIF